MLFRSIQTAQNLDLSKFSGKRVKRWTYEIKNYPGYESKPGVVQANLLIDRGVVVGGDVCSLELGGFLHGFDMPNRQPVQQTSSMDLQHTDETTASHDPTK